MAGCCVAGWQRAAVLGCDGAGVVVETGSLVTQFKVGDRVWYCHGGLGGDQGNYAEFNVLDERWVAHIPKTLSFEQAAAGPLVLITAWGALYDRARLQQSNTVLIHAGAGGVGHVAIQLARLHGAKVIATVGSERRREPAASERTARPAVLQGRAGISDAAPTSHIANMRASQMSVHSSSQISRRKK